MNSTSVNEVDINKNYFTISPNPARNSISIKSAVKINSIEISDVSGEPVLSRKMVGTTSDIDLSSLPNGVFLLKATYPNGEFCVRKVVKN
jgi:hypothetical protein